VATSQFPYSATAGSYIINFQMVGVKAFVRAIGTNEANDATPTFVFSDTLVGSFNGSSQIIASGPNNVSANVKVGFASDASGRSLCYAGGSVTSDANTMPSYSLLKLGAGIDSSSTTMSGWIRQITYIPRRLTNAELISRTA
jgi:hypothetical protein